MILMKCMMFCESIKINYCERGNDLWENIYTIRKEWIYIIVRNNIQFLLIKYEFKELWGPIIGKKFKKVKVRSFFEIDTNIDYTVNNC